MSDIEFAPASLADSESRLYAGQLALMQQLSRIIHVPHDLAEDENPCIAIASLVTDPVGM